MNTDDMRILLSTSQQIIILNLKQAEKIYQYIFNTFTDIAKIAKEISLATNKNILLFNISLYKSHFIYDFWTDGKKSFWLSSQRDHTSIDQADTTIISAAIQTCIDANYTLKDAIIIAIMFFNQQLRSGKISSRETLTNFNWPEQQIDLSYLSQHPLTNFPVKFSTCGPEPLGLYPIIDSIDWLKILLPTGIKTIQLRIKNKTGTVLQTEIQQSIALAKKYKVRLFINDFWQEAIAFDAYGVHLGQEDLTDANVELIRQKGLRLGVSTHGYYEVARAHAFNPSYLACGPIFETTSKIMNVPPQSIEKLQRWQRTLHYPLVAIGGINAERLAAIAATHVDGIAMISAITQAKDPIATVQKFLKIIRNNF